MKEHKYYETEEHALARKLYSAGLNIYMLGPAGCGKTTFARIMTGPGNYVLCSCSNDMKPSNLIGHFELIDEQTKFIYGPLVKAMRENKVLILDEFDRVSEDVASKLHEVLESGELLVEATNEVITASGDFRIIATGNSDMQGSVEYNTNALDLASIDRFEFVHFNFTKREADILIEEGLTKEDAKALLDSAKIIRKGNYSILPSTRRLISIARMVRVGLSLEEAFKIGYLSRLPEDEAKSIQAVKKNVGASSSVWTFKDDTPKAVIDKVSKLLSPQETSIFVTTLTCLVTDKLQGMLEEVAPYLEDRVEDKEGVTEEEFIK
jgi:MoxR-like ATPase